MPKYRVVVYGGMDGLSFDDLLVKYTTGYQFPLKVKQGNYVPVEIFDPSDIQKSLAVGTLRRYIDSGAVVAEYGDLEKKRRQRKPRKKKAKDIKLTVKPSVEDKEVQKEELKPKEPQQKPEEPETTEFKQIDLKDVNKSDDFFKLSYFNKLQFIQNCSDKGLLTELLNKVDSAQLKTNITYRLQHI